MGFEYGLALHLGLLAIVAANTIWRLADSENIVEQLISLINHKRLGFLTWPYVWNWRLVIIKLIIMISAFLASIIMFYIEFKYFRKVEIIYGPTSITLDMGVIRSLWLTLSKIDKQAIAYFMIVNILLLLDYLLSLLYRALPLHKPLKDLTNFYHKHQLPKYWISSPEAMWEHRINAINSLYPTKQLIQNTQQIITQRSWRTDWTVWSKCVVGYQIWIFNNLKNDQYVL